MASLKQTLAAMYARHTQEILDVLAAASLQDFQEVVSGLRGERRGPKGPKAPARSVKPNATASHAVEKNAASVVAQLKHFGPLRAEELRLVLALSRKDLVKALALALAWKTVTKTGEKRATVYKAVKQRGPKPQLTLRDRMRAAPFMK